MVDTDFLDRRTTPYSRSSQSIPVTFELESAGSVTVWAVVAAEGQDPSPTYHFPDPDEDPSS